MRTKQKLTQTRAGQTRGLGSRSGRHRPPRERWEEARGGRRPQPTMDPSPDDAEQTTVIGVGEAEQTRRARRGREQDVAEISRRLYEKIRSSRDPRDNVEDGRRG